MNTSLLNFFTAKSKKTLNTQETLNEEEDFLTSQITFRKRNKNLVDFCDTNQELSQPLNDSVKPEEQTQA